MVEGIEDKHADLVVRFEELAPRARNHPNFRQIKAQFDRGMSEFSDGYESGDDDLIYNGFEGMQQAVEELEIL